VRALLAIEERGSGDPLVLVHGIATNRQIWNLVVPVLAADRRVVTLDVPGFGDSPPVDDGFELESVAERIARGLARRRIRGPYDVVGHSLGAGVALALAEQRPSSVRRLLLVAPAGFEAIPRAVSVALAAGADGWLAARRRLAPLSDLRWGRRLLLGFAAADGGELPPGLARQMIEASAGARRTASAMATITRADLGPRLAKTAMPLGVIWGTEDRTVPPRLAEAVTAARPDAEIAMIDGTGHVPMLERPDAFARAVDELLGRLPKDATSLR
jgi:pimeloyl-ACP methyl ester carboxylesterase